MATPVYDCLRMNFPKADLIGLIRTYARGVVEDGPWFDKLIDGNDKTRTGFIQLVKEIRLLKPDLAVILPNSFRAALIARLGGSKRICGYRRGNRSFLLSGGPRPTLDSDKVVPVPMPDYYLEICRFLNLKLPGSSHPRLFYSDGLEQKSSVLLDNYGISPEDMVIGLNPGAKFGSSKCWPPEHFARLAELLTDRWRCKLLLFTGPGEKAIGRQIIETSDATIIDTSPDRVDLALLKPLIKRCRLFVTNDTGPRHYAVALGVPQVVIMGPTDPRYTNVNLEKTVVLRQDLPCSPCHLKICPIDHRCMTRILPEHVLQASETLLTQYE